MTALSDGAQHRPVLYKEIIQALQPAAGGFYIDGTLGAGGHAWGILSAGDPDSRLLGMDVDPQALALARERLAPFGGRVRIVQSSYDRLSEELATLGSPEVNGIMLDLGVSSMQLDTPERGFSFKQDAPLDMRFNPKDPVRASDLVNQMSEAELRNLLYRYGEEERAARIARAIVRERPLETTGELADLILRTVGRERGARGKGMHPATRTFQALRIAVNRELENLERVLPQAVSALTPGGRLAVISFHSLEDRIVKQYFRRESRDCLCPSRQPVCTCGHTASLIEITRSPIKPGDDEVSRNPRARSARLRIAERISNKGVPGT